MDNMYFSNLEVMVLMLRHKDKLTLSDTGKKLGFTRERVRQIQAKAEEKLRQISEKNEKMPYHKWQSVMQEEAKKRIRDIAYKLFD